MTSDQIDFVIRDYLALGPEGRRTDPRIGRDRHTLIMSGAAILQALMRVWPTDRLSVADRGLREGLLYAQMSADGAIGLPWVIGGLSVVALAVPIVNNLFG